MAHVALVGAPELVALAELEPMAEAGVVIGEQGEAAGEDDGGRQQAPAHKRAPGADNRSRTTATAPIPVGREPRRRARAAPALRAQRPPPSAPRQRQRQ